MGLEKGRSARAIIRDWAQTWLFKSFVFPGDVGILTTSLHYEKTKITIKPIILKIIFPARHFSVKNIDFFKKKIVWIKILI